MAKQLLLNILVDTLGQYIDGLSAENIKLGVWSGKVNLNNLKLREGALDQLNLPISVKRGSLKTLSLHIPWRSLESKPTRITIDGIYALVRQSCEVSPEIVGQKALESLRRAFESAAESIITDHRDNEPTSVQKQTYIKHLTRTILDNIEFKITNVHIRYEDTDTFPGRSIAAGLTLDSLQLLTTDVQWNEKFVSRRESEVINKLGRIKNIGVYWNTDSDCLGDLPHEMWLIKMHSLIYDSVHVMNMGEVGADGSSSSKTSPLHQYQLMFLRPPPNTFTVKMIQSNATTKSIPLLAVTIESPDMRVTLDNLQIKQMMSTAYIFRQHLQVRQMALFRPTCRPNENPRLW